MLRGAATLLVVLALASSTTSTLPLPSGPIRADPEPTAAPVGPRSAAPAPETLAPAKPAAAQPDAPVVDVPEEHPSLYAEMISGETGERVTGGKISLAWRYGEFKAKKMTPVDGGFRIARAQFEIDESQYLRFVVQPPKGFVTEDPAGVDFDPRPTRYTKDIHARIAVWPEADLRVFVRRSNGWPAAYARVEWVALGERHSLRVTAPFTDRRGITRVPGVPAIPGEPVQVLARRGRREAVSGEVLLRRSTEEVWTEVSLPDRPGRASLYLGPAGCVTVCGRDPRDDPPPGNASLRVEIRRTDGRPAHGASLCVSGKAKGGWTWRMWTRADEFGNARFDGLPAGPAEVRVIEPGFLMGTGQPVDLVTGTTIDTVIREDRGVPLTVVVTDSHGRPVTGAEIEIGPAGPNSLPILDGDTQRYGFHTGTDGRFTFPRIPDGTDLCVTARLGSRKACEWIESGGEVRITIE